jgi:hypothetical protein
MEKVVAQEKNEWNRGGTRGIAGKTANDSPKVENLVHPTAENKHVIYDSSIH